MQVFPCLQGRTPLFLPSILAADSDIPDWGANFTGSADGVENPSLGKGQTPWCDSQAP